MITYIIIYIYIYISYEDDIDMITNQLEQAHEFLTSIEIETEKIGLELTSNKTEVMVFNHPITVSVYSQENITDLKVVDNFKYLCLWMASSDQDFNIRKAMSWRACHKMKRLLNSILDNNLNIGIFKVITYS